MKARVDRINAQKFARAKELIALADLRGHTIGWEGEYMTFHPADTIEQKFIEEATILSPYIKRLFEVLKRR